MSTSTEDHKQQVQDTPITTNDKGTSTEKQDEAVYKKLEGEELLDAIRKQVEYYFSRQNLANDPFLVQHMNNQLYVPIEFIASFKLIKNLTEDVTLIREAIKTSKSVILDETQTKLKPDFNLPRNTVILRDIPSTTDVEDVRKIFANDNLPKQIQSQIGDNWFIIFETDDQALLALDQIRGKEINGHAVHARIKTENILKAFTYGLHGGAPPVQYQTTSFGRGYAPRNAWDQQQPYQQDQSAGRGFRNSRASKSNKGQQQQQQNKKKEGVSQPNPQQHKKGRGGHQQDHLPQNTPQQQQQQSQDQKRPKSGKRGSQEHTQPEQSQAHDQQDNRSVGRGKRRPSFSRAHPPPSLASVKNFPPLPTISKADLLKSGYENDKYLSYPKGAIISVYNNNLKSNNLQRPSEMPEDCPAVLSTPKAQLELTKPPLPHHEVQQHPEHVEEGEKDQESQYLQQFENTTTPKKNSPSVTSQRQPLQQSPVSSVAPSELPTVVKSFAEAAITAKDIKTPEYTRVEPKRRNSLKGGKTHSGEQEFASQQQQQNQSQQQIPKEQSRGRRNSLGSGRLRRKNSLDSKDSNALASGSTTTANSKPKKNKGQQQSAPKQPEVQQAEASSVEAQHSSTLKPKRKRNKNKNRGLQDMQNQVPAQTHNQPASPILGDSKSYASIANKAKDTSSPKTVEHQPSPKTHDNTVQQGKNTSK